MIDERQKVWMESKQEILLITQQSGTDTWYWSPRWHQLWRRNASVSLEMWRNTASRCEHHSNFSIDTKTLVSTLHNIQINTNTHQSNCHLLQNFLAAAYMTMPSVCKCWFFQNRFCWPLWIDFYETLKHDVYWLATVHYKEIFLSIGPKKIGAQILPILANISGR